MSDTVKATESWLIELYAPNGIESKDIVVSADESYDTTPEKFRESVDETYLQTLAEKTQDILNEGNTPVIYYNDESREVTIEDDGLVYTGGEPVVIENTARPTLYARTDEGDTEKVFWDGDTFVSTPQIEGNTVTFEAFTGSYAERLAAKDVIGEYAVEDLPLSTNITVVPILEKDEEQVMPVFYRDDNVAEYPNYVHTVAGGIPDINMNPLDAGWMEMQEEIRVVPDIPTDELYGRNILAEEIEVRPELLGDNTVYPIVGGDGYELLFRAPDEMKMLGLVRNLETHAPEICAVVETDIPYEVVADNYVRGAEHADIEPLPVDADAVQEFRETRENIIPVGDAAFLLATDYLTGSSLVEEVTQGDVPKHYAGWETDTIK